jgi:hypothetical protein
MEVSTDPQATWIQLRPADAQPESMSAASPRAGMSAEVRLRLGERVRALNGTDDRAAPA